MEKKIYVTKMNGERELYNENKLHLSMKKAGADNKAIERVLNKINKIIYNGIETKKLFKFVFTELRKEKSDAGVKYNIKQGLIEMSLGGGYIFEKFIAKILEKQGYKIELNKIVNGRFVTHEIDITAKKEDETLMVEAKHHHKPWLGCDIQTALYTYARFLDVKDKFTKPMLATNTKFSQQVIDYSKGVGVKLMGWDYPKGNSLEEELEKYKIYPITILPIAKNKIKNYLERNILTFEDLLNEKNLNPEIKEYIERIIGDKIKNNEK